VREQRRWGRAAPLQTLGRWTRSTRHFNQTETSIPSSAASDRSIAPYHARTALPLARSVLHMTTNALAWNPLEAINLAAANEDNNIYIFDMRNLACALDVLRDHAHVAMDVVSRPDQRGAGQRVIRRLTSALSPFLSSTI
jgi:WD repeat and SOF domain-containing protein 1